MLFRSETNPAMKSRISVITTTRAIEITDGDDGSKVTLTGGVSVSISDGGGVLALVL